VTYTATPTEGQEIPHVPVKVRKAERTRLILDHRDAGRGVAEIARLVGAHPGLVAKTVRDAARAENPGPDATAVADAVRKVLHGRLIKHFERADVRARLTEQMGIDHSLYWPVLGLIEERLFAEQLLDGDEDGRKGLIPRTGLERVSPTWLLALARRLDPAVAVEARPDGLQAG